MKIYQKTDIGSVAVEVHIFKDGRVSAWCPGMTEPIVMTKENSTLIFRAVAVSPDRPVTIAVERGVTDRADWT